MDDGRIGDCDGHVSPHSAGILQNHQLALTVGLSYRIRLGRGQRRHWKQRASASIDMKSTLQRHNNGIDFVQEEQLGRYLTLGA